MAIERQPIRKATERREVPKFITTRDNLTLRNPRFGAPEGRRWVGGRDLDRLLNKSSKKATDESHQWVNELMRNDY